MFASAGRATTPTQLKGVTLTEEDITQRYAAGTERVEKGVYIVRPEVNGGPKGRLGALPMPKAMLAMTVALRGRLEGLLVFDNLHDGNAFDHSDLQRVSRLREHAIGAVAKARTLVTLQEKTLALQQQKEQVEQAYDNVELLSRIGRDITARLSIEEIIATVYQNVNALMDAAVFGIGLCNEARTRIEFPATRENGEALPPFGYALTDDSRLAVVCFRRRQEIVIEDMAREHQRYIREHKPPVAGKPVASIIYLPLVHKDRADRRHHRPELPHPRVHRLPPEHPAQPRHLRDHRARECRRVPAPERHARAAEDDAGAAGRAGEAGVARRADRRHRPRDQEPAELRQQLRGVEHGAGRRSCRQALESERERLGPAAYDDSAPGSRPTCVLNARKINEHGRRADSIIRGMLLHSRGHSGRAPGRPTSTRCSRNTSTSPTTACARRTRRSTSRSSGTTIRPSGPCAPCRRTSAACS